MMKRLPLIMLATLTVAILIACAAPAGTPEATPSLIKVDGNLDATEVRAGMVYGEDFAVDDEYQRFWVGTVMCDDIHMEENTVHYTVAKTAEYTPYWMWVCYPKWEKSSRATAIFMKEDPQTEVWTVTAVVRMDTEACLRKFGGTYGTKQKGW